jgi:hypothetical protein
VLAERRRRDQENSETSAVSQLSKALFGAEGDSEHTRLFWDEGAHICPACGKHELRFSGASMMFD